MQFHVEPLLGNHRIYTLRGPVGATELRGRFGIYYHYASDPREHAVGVSRGPLAKCPFLRGGECWPSAKALSAADVIVYSSADEPMIERLLEEHYERLVESAHQVAT